MSFDRARLLPSRMTEWLARLLRPALPRQRWLVDHYLDGSSGSAADAARRAGYPWPEQMDRKTLRFVEKTRSSNKQNAQRGQKCWQRLERNRSPSPTPAGARWPGRRLPEAEGPPTFWHPGNVGGRFRRRWLGFRGAAARSMGRQAKWALADQLVARKKALTADPALQTYLRRVT